MAAPTETKVLKEKTRKIQCEQNNIAQRDFKNTHIPLVLVRSTREPHGPLLALSKISKSTIFLSPFLNQLHFNWPRASAVGKRSADFANPEKIDIKALIVIPSLQLGRSLPSCLSSTIAIIAIQRALKPQLSISKAHQSINHLVNQPEQLFVLDAFQEKRDGGLLNPWR
jgi:hypothetical protein